MQQLPRVGKTESLYIFTYLYIMQKPLKSLGFRQVVVVVVEVVVAFVVVVVSSS